MSGSAISMSGRRLSESEWLYTCLAIYSAESDSLLTHFVLQSLQYHPLIWPITRIFGSSNAVKYPLVHKSPEMSHLRNQDAGEDVA